MFFVSPCFLWILVGNDCVYGERRLHQNEVEPTNPEAILLYQVQTCALLRHDDCLSVKTEALT